jgi:hypothetical protein
MCKAVSNISCALVILCCYICKQMGERSSRKEKESVCCGEKLLILEGN